MEACLRLNLLLHYYDDEGKFIGQRFINVQMKNQRDIDHLLALLAEGRRPSDYKGSMDYPLSSEAYRCVKVCLEEAFSELFNPYNIVRTARSVRVMQIQQLGEV